MSNDNSDQDKLDKLDKSFPISSRTRHKAPLNSTATENQDEIPEESISSYREAISPEDVFQESTLSQGTGTNLLSSLSRQGNNDMDEDFNLPENIDSMIETIRIELDCLEYDVKRTEGWTSSYTTLCREMHQ